MEECRGHSVGDIRCVEFIQWETKGEAHGIKRTGCLQQTSAYGQDRTGHAMTLRKVMKTTALSSSNELIALKCSPRPL